MTRRKEHIAQEASDIPKGNWIDHWVPGKARPYCRLARLDRPIGSWLLLFPCWWGLALGAASLGQTPPLWMFALFALGAVAMRGAGCTINDMADRDFDRQVVRTADRPLASGALSMKQATVFLAAQMVIGLGVLLTLKMNAALIAIASIPLVFTYPFMKRFTYWPQAFLGLTFNWGALVGWVAVTGTLGWPAVFLYLAGFFWTLGYDTIYAHQDKEDDMRIGVKSTALRFGAASRAWVLGFYLAMLLCLKIAGLIAGLAWPYWVCFPLLFWFLFQQASVVDFNDPAHCLRHFKANRWAGWILLIGLLAAGVQQGKSLLSVPF